MASAAAATSTAFAAPLDGPEEVTATVAKINAAYTSLHEAYEENFWKTKMGLKVCFLWERLSERETTEL